LSGMQYFETGEEDRCVTTIMIKAQCMTDKFKQENTYEDR